MRGSSPNSRSSSTYESVAVALLQDGPGRRAILIPLDGQSATDLPAGAYQLTFAIERSRWPTLQPLDALNHYARTATLNFSL